MSKINEGDYYRSIVLTLVVPKASKKDSGNYTCMATAPTYESSIDSLNIQVNGIKQILSIFDMKYNLFLPYNDFYFFFLVYLQTRSSLT